jgi:uncharacterized protein (TIGR00661 family)
LKILYGVQGTGNGHIARARAMSDALKKQNVDVQFLFSGRDKGKFFSMESFGDYQVRRGLTFVSEQGEVNHLKTVLNNNAFSLMSEIRDLDLSEYDLVLNDFEPISAWAAQRQKKTSIGISHQNAFRYPIPQKDATWLDKQIVHRFAPANFHLGLHWYHFDQPILPPIVNTRIMQTEKQNFILVYLPFESIHEVSDLLLRFANQSFVCYHPAVIDNESVENIQFCPLGHESFQVHLHHCSGVIANGGFELPSEAMSLGKKLLLKPLSGQFEQQSNVATLEMLGLASSMDFLDAAVVRNWLDEKQADRVVYPNVAEAIAKWVVKGDWENHQELCDELWQQVDFPSYVSIN